MPYSAEHKRETRSRIIECARSLFNRRGFADVSIDDVMSQAGLTRGGFYNHFATKEDLFIETIRDYETCSPSDRWDTVDLDFSMSADIVTRQMIDAYLSEEHLADIDAQCPLVALPSDVAHAGEGVRQAYENLLKKMASILERGLGPSLSTDTRERALGITALCIGGMLLGRTVPDPEFGRDALVAARKLAREILDEMGTG